MEKQFIVNFLLAMASLFIGIILAKIIFYLYEYEWKAEDEKFSDIIKKNNSWSSIEIPRRKNNYDYKGDDYIITSEGIEFIKPNEIEYPLFPRNLTEKEKELFGVKQYLPLNPPTN